MEINSWHAVQEEVLRRIKNRSWKPGELIPNEADLAIEFGCARATVNRALRALAETGILDRRRKAGTRVALHPVRKVTLEIPIIRHEVEQKQQHYDYALISAKLQTPPAAIRGKMGLASVAKAMKICALHLAGGRPYVLEDRWINMLAVPDIKGVDFNLISANEWLVANVRYSHGDILFSARSADATLAERLGADVHDALFVIERNTWDEDTSITSAQLIYAPGHHMRTTI